MNNLVGPASDDKIKYTHNFFEYTSVLDFN